MGNGRCMQLPWSPATAQRAGLCNASLPLCGCKGAMTEGGTMLPPLLQQAGAQQQCCARQHLHGSVALVVE